jgi:2,4-dienoyl-CoA reductase (NADPH2)
MSSNQINVRKGLFNMVIRNGIVELATTAAINGLEIRNRIVMTAVHLGYTPDGTVSDRLVEFYRERSRGGVGLIVIGGCTVDEYSGRSEMIGLHDDRFVQGLSRLSEAIHSHGAKVFAQLYHSGRYAHSATIGGRRPLAPSAIASKLTREMPKAMDSDEIRMVQESFARAALRAKTAGMDGVEVIGGAGYLISQFMSRVTNIREDDYGGSWENRTRFGREVVEQVRQAVGPKFPVMVRIAGNDFMPGGNGNMEAALFAQVMEASGADAIDVTGGWHETQVPQLTMMVPQGGFSYLARGVLAKVKVPVVVCNRINDPVLADEFLRRGQADLIGMARALIADPELPNKAINGDFDAIRHCIACNQGCFDRVTRGAPVGCLVNPRVGREMEPEMTPLPVKTRKKVVVIGGGPAGMMAAVTAAQRGHRVTLYERSSMLGGQLPLAAAPPGRREMATLVRDLSSQLHLCHVEVILGQEVDSGMVESISPDAVVVATGALPLIPDIPGIHFPHVVNAWDVLAGRVDLDSPVAIIGGGAVGCETALTLARIGTISADDLHFLFENQAETPDTLRSLILHGTFEIAVVEMLTKIGRDIGPSTRWSILQDMSRRGIRTYEAAKAVEITTESVLIEQEGHTIHLPAKSVVAAVGARPVNRLYEQLREKVQDVYLIGDAKKPRKALEAVHEGFEIGLRI